MKVQLTLWFLSILITFLTGYIKTVTDSVYPVTGTYDIGSKTITYKLDKVYYGKDSYTITVANELDGLEGKLVWRKSNSTNVTALEKKQGHLVGELPVDSIGEKIHYNIMLFYKGKTFQIPEHSEIILTTYGKIPSTVNILRFMFLYCGLLLGIRTALEIFNRKSKIKRFAFVTTCLFIFLTILVSPLRNSYKLGAINKSIPPVLALIEIQYILIVIIWLAGTVLIFNNKAVRYAAIFSAAATIVIYYTLTLS